MNDPKPVSTSKKDARGPQDARTRFKQVVLTLDKGCCIAESDDDACMGPLQAHHVVPQWKLRDLGYPPPTIWSSGIGATVCERHHRRHHNRVQPLRRDMLPKRCVGFVHGLGLDDLLDRFYL